MLRSLVASFGATAPLLLGSLGLALILPFRTFAETLPAPAFLAALALFLTPGLVLARTLSIESFSGLARLPLAFVLSTSVFALAAVPMLLLRLSLTAYLLLCALVLAASLALAARELALETRTEPPVRPFALPNPLWAPFVVLAGSLAYWARVWVQRPLDDGWYYLGQVREYVDGDRLGGGEVFSRASINGWLVVEAALSRVSGVDPLVLVFGLLAPALVLVALLALYALGKVLFEDETAALLSVSLAALLLLVHLDSPLLSPVGEFAGRISEDKFLARFVFLPTILAAATLFLRERRPRRLALFALLSLGVAAVHPVGVILAFIAVGSLGVMHLAAGFRERGTWTGVGGLAAVLLGILVPPTVYLLATGSPLLSRLESASAGTSAYLLSSWQYEERLLDLGGGLYVMHPSLLLHPLVVAVYLVGVPFLLWRIKESLAARVLLGVLVLAPVPIYVPPVATLLGELIGPWVLYRFSWPLTLAATLTLGWASHETLRYAGLRLRSIPPARRLVPYLPLALVCLLAAMGAGQILNGLRSADASAETPQDGSSCYDPAFEWMREEIPTPGKVLAQEEEGGCLPAYSARAITLGSRDGISGRAREELNRFYESPVVDEEILGILERREIDHVLLRADSPLIPQLDHLPSFAATDTPGDRYRLYTVDREALSPTPAVAANSFVYKDDPEGAIRTYLGALEDGRTTTDDRFLAHLGLGLVHAREGRYAEAARAHNRAAEMDPQDPAPHSLASEAYRGAGSAQAARDKQERAVELAPQNTELRRRLGALLLDLGDAQQAVSRFREVATEYPDVPQYRADLGRALYLSGDPEAAGEEYERAARLDPLSPTVHAYIGQARTLAGDLAGAATSYREATALDPKDQLHALRLGETHAALSTQGGRYDEEHFEEAQEWLKHAQSLPPDPTTQDHGADISLALGDLYRDWNREAEAREAYEDASELNPDSAARARLENLEKS